METKCSVHNVEWKTIPAGVSRKTNKPYPSFQVCPIEGCNQKPNGVSVSTGPQTGQQVAPPVPQTIAPDPYSGLEQRLMDLPAEIASAAEELNKKIFELDKKKLDTKKEEAKALVELIDSGLTSPEKQAKVNLVILPFEVDEIVTEKDMRIAKGLYEKLINTFDAIRKVASIKIAEMGRQADSI
jgi:hypothetical protein